MSNRVCRDCRAIYNPQSTGARNGRCPTCARTADQARGTRTDRGYGPQHQALRAHWQQRINAGEDVRCARCREPILRGSRWALDHTGDRTGYLGPSHEFCNNQAGGQAAHHIKTPASAGTDRELGRL